MTEHDRRRRRNAETVRGLHDFQPISI